MLHVIPDLFNFRVVDFDLTEEIPQLNFDYAFLERKCWLSVLILHPE